MIIFLLFIVVAIGLTIVHFMRSREILENWAEENAFQILEASIAFFFRRPFFWTTGKGQSVYRVVVADADGNEFSGWVRCGSWLWGIFSNTAEARWDE